MQKQNLVMLISTNGKDNAKNETLAQKINSNCITFELSIDIKIRNRQILPTKSTEIQNVKNRYTKHTS